MDISTLEHIKKRVDERIEELEKYRDAQLEESYEDVEIIEEDDSALDVSYENDCEIEQNIVETNISKKETNWHFAEEDDEYHIKTNIFSVAFMGSASDAKRHISESVAKYAKAVFDDEAIVFLTEYLLANYNLFVFDTDVSDDTRKAMTNNFIKNCLHHAWNCHDMLQRINASKDPEKYRKYISLFMQNDESDLLTTSIKDLIYDFFSFEYKELALISEPEIFLYDPLSRKTFFYVTSGELDYIVKNGLEILESKLKGRNKTPEKQITQEQTIEDMSRDIFGMAMVTEKSSEETIPNDIFEQTKSFIDEWTPIRIFTYLDKHIIRQSEAKMAAATFTYEHFYRVLHPNEIEKRSLCLVGPPGVGKTEIFRKLAEICPKGMVDILDISGITQRGYQGADLDQYVKQILRKSPEMRYGIIIGDEVDKLCMSNHSSDGDDVSALIQASLLKIVEDGYTIDRDSRKLDIPNVSWAFCGAFHGMDDETKSVGFCVNQDFQSEKKEDLSEKIVQFGMSAELARRISTFVSLERLEVEDYYALMSRPGINICDKLRNRYRTIYGINVSVSTEAKRIIAEKAYRKNLGVTAMESILDSHIRKYLFQEFRKQSGMIKVTNKDFESYKTK